MQTNWGEMQVSDAHVHYFSQPFFSSLAAQRKSSYDDLKPALGWELPSDDPAALADRWVAELDRHGVSRAALIASVPGDEGSVAAAVTRHPGRFHGFFMVNPTLASPETHLASALAPGNLHDGALQGLCLFPAMHRYSVQDER